MPSLSRPPRSVSLISSQWCSISQVKVRANSKLEIQRCASLSRAKSAGRSNSRDARAGAREPHRRVLDQRAGDRLELVPDMALAKRDVRRAVERRDRLRRDAEQHVAVERDVLDRARQDAERVERAGRLHHAVQAVLAPGRAIADHAAERGGPDGRAGGLRADRERHHEIGDRGGRAARRAARRAREVVRVAGRAGMQVGEFGGDGLAEQQAAGLAGQRHAGGVALRLPALVDRRAPFGRHVGGVDDVLDAERHAGERALARRRGRARAPLRSPARRST